MDTVEITYSALRKNSEPYFDRAVNDCVAVGKGKTMTVEDFRRSVGMEKAS